MSAGAKVVLWVALLAACWAVKLAAAWAGDLAVLRAAEWVDRLDFLKVDERVAHLVDWKAVWWVGA